MTSSDGHKLPPRPVRESQSEMAEVVLPNDGNPLGNLLGGRLMDHIDFLAPVLIGDLLILKSSVNRAFKTSMEIGVKCWVENYIAATTRHVASAYLTFVAVDEQGKRKSVPPVVPET